jgi:ABC transport system ATP-binding/permease protein
MALLSAQNLVLRFGGPPLLDGVSFDIEPGDRVCLMGRNGEGKSTLLKILTGEMEAGSGDIIKRTGLKIARLIQEIPADLSGTVRDIVLGHGSALGQADSHDALDWNAEAVLGKTGLDPEALYNSLSGGQKRRALFARAIAHDPDLLLLDEPTNHLDIPGIQWLEDMVSRLPCAVLFISHDRAFVRRIASRILEIDRGKVRTWNFSYDKYVELRDARLEDEEKASKLFDKRLAEEEIWIRKGVKARGTRNEGRVRALKRMREERAQRRERQGNVQMAITEAEKSGRLVVRATNLSYAWPSRTVVRGFNTEIVRGDRIGLVGSNGSGKTTLLRLLLGELQPQSGDVRLGSNLQIAYFDQMRGQLREDQTLLDNIGNGQEWVMLGGQKRHVLSYLQDFLFSADRARGPISALSGGERNRLLLARLFCQPSNVLVLDEPTNDLDMETLDLLQELLCDYAGTVLVVSHDRSFLDEVATSVIALEDDNAYEYVGGYSDWERQTAARKAAAKAAETPKATAKAISAEAETTVAPAKKKLSYKEQRELDELPKRIEKLESAIADLHAQLADPAIYTNAPRLTDLQQQLARQEEELFNAYAKWEELS